jgi:hypothetical protein
MRWALRQLGLRGRRAMVLIATDPHPRARERLTGSRTPRPERALHPSSIARALRRRRRAIDGAARRGRGRAVGAPAGSATRVPRLARWSPSCSAAGIGIGGEAESRARAQEPERPCSAPIRSTPSPGRRASARPGSADACGRATPGLRAPRGEARWGLADLQRRARSKPETRSGGRQAALARATAEARTWPGRVRELATSPHPLSAVRNAVWRRVSIRTRAALDIACRGVDQLARSVDTCRRPRITPGKIALRRHRRHRRERAPVTRPLIEERSHELEVTLPAWAVCRRRRDAPEQVVANLSRTQPSTGPGGHRSGRAREGEVVLRVRDDGIGIAREVRARLRPVRRPTAPDHFGADSASALGRRAGRAQRVEVQQRRRLRVVVRFTVSDGPAAAPGFASSREHTGPRECPRVEATTALPGAVHLSRTGTG